MKHLILTAALTVGYFLAYSQAVTEAAIDKINEKSIIGSYSLNDSISGISVTFEIKKNHKFKSIKLKGKTVTTGTGGWKIDQDTLVLEDITTIQKPMPEGDVFSENEIKMVFRDRDLYAVLSDGRPAGNIRLKRK
jgi:hypothetical protein